MLLGLLRDRAALAMSFLVPAAFFLIFASIATATTRQDVAFKVAIADEIGSETSQRLLLALGQAPTFTAVGAGSTAADEVRAWVRRGTADVGLIVRSDSSGAAPGAGRNGLSLVVVSDAARGVAARLLSAELQRAYLYTLREPPPGGQGSAGHSPEMGLDPHLTQENVTGVSAGLNHVAYHAGAVAVLFLLFSAVHGALTLLEEKETGILERILAGPGSTVVLVNGKFLYLVAQGFVQVGVIFVVAWQVHGVDLPAHWAGWALITVATAAAAAGMALAVTAACTTKSQAQSIATVAVLILSALGGSMAPRFLMPAWLQDLGWLTPNTWAIEAYAAMFWRDEPLSALVWPTVVLLGAAASGLLLAQWLARRLQEL